MPATNNLERLYRGQGKTAPAEALLAGDLAAPQRMLTKEQLVTANAQWTLAGLRSNSGSMLTPSDCFARQRTITIEARMTGGDIGFKPYWARV